MGSVLDILIQQKAQVLHMNTLAQSDKITEVMTDIQFKDLTHLQKIIRQLKKHPKVVSVSKENGQ